MKIFVIGTRGIPEVLGGVETHCQHLYPRLAKSFGHEITVIARSPYVPYEQSAYKGVNLQSVWAPKTKSVEAIIHSFLAAIKAKQAGATLIHVHAIGPGLLVPFCKLLGLKVVFTHHGPDYDRQKWGKLAKMVLKTGERFAAKFADEVIVISSVIDKIIGDKYQRQDAHLIYNGVERFDPSTIESASYLKKHGLTTGKYYVAVGRFVEEKGFHDLIHAYEASDKAYPLVIVGDADHETEYSRDLKTLANKTNGVYLTGFINGEELKAIFSSAHTFIMPSYHEGLPIALLEALSYGLEVIVSDIPANLEVKLQESKYVPVGIQSALTEKLNSVAASEKITPDYGPYLEKYDWDEIAKQTEQVYKQAAGLTNVVLSRQ